MLDDVFAKGLKVVFVGMAAGIVSAQRREHYAHSEIGSGRLFSLSG
jgi:G:T/U-mismatch repair DNA glycosylase